VTGFWLVGAWLSAPIPAQSPPPARVARAVSLTLAHERSAILQAQPDPARGQTLFLLCERCHGSDGRGETNGAVPAIAGQYRRIIVQELLAFRHGKRRDPAMEQIATSHALSHAQDIADVAAFVSGLPHAVALQTGDGELLTRGAEVYPRLCASCHGARAEGNARRGVPWLASQQYGYLQLEMYYVIDDRRPNMMADHWSLFRHFDRSEFEGLPDYLSRLPP
jgi:cytochrome c553